MKVTAITNVVGALGLTLKLLVKRLEDIKISEQVETSKTTPLLRSARILRTVLETLRDLHPLKLLGKIISERWFEKHSGSKL